jgi:response regulator RpfG family c-di-GMP phosphodiesterase/serine/threonine protein kinase
MGPATLPLGGRIFAERLLQLYLLDAASLETFLTERGGRCLDLRDDEHLGRALVQAGLLTNFQLERVLSGNTHGLVLGSYRLLDRLGSGGMGVVYLAEHCLLKRRVAVKVLPVDDDCPPSVLKRFYAEMHVLAELRHPNVVLAFDAGEVPAPGPNMPGLTYLVMEVVDGGDLGMRVQAQGRCSIADACGYARQAACGLQAAHDQHLVHRDLKPSNLLLNSAGQVKLVDFGLARKFSSRLTDPRMLLGSLEFMAPEQSHDPSAVGKEADIYSLGATLFWLLTEEGPYPFLPTVSGALRALQREPPRRLRQVRPEAPEALDTLVARMLDRNSAHRPATALEVMTTLTPFTSEPAVCLLSGRPAAGPSTKGGTLPRRALIVDDEAGMRALHRLLLQSVGCSCLEVIDGASALAAAAAEPFDLVVLDLALPDINGYEVCRRLRERTDNPHLKIVIVSGQGDANALAEALPRGADDYVSKPFEPRQLAAKVEHALRLKEAQDRAALLAEQLLDTNRRLQESLSARLADVRQAHNALLFTVAKMAESRDGETAGHLRRLQLYTRVLARHAAKAPPWEGLVDDRFLQQLERCVPLHDIGKIGLPDEVLLKPGALDVAERALIETHVLIGDRILEALGREHGTSLEFLGTARALVRHHHERWDGMGYPDRLAGEAIPAAARVTAVADVYDALRRRRQHKAPLSHVASVEVLTRRSDGQFDPHLVRALAACHGEFERIYRDITE